MLVVVGGNRHVGLAVSDANSAGFMSLRL